MGSDAPLCPHGHGPMMKVTVSQGDVLLGYLWFCVNDDEGSPDYCDECEDCDDPLPVQIGQMEMFV